MKKNNKIISGILAVVVIVTAVLGTLVVNGLNKDKKDKTQDVDSIISEAKKLVEVKKDLKIGTGTTELNSIGSKEKIQNIVKANALLFLEEYTAREDVEYSNMQIFGGLNNSGSKDSAETETSAAISDVATGTESTSEYYKNNDQVEGVIEGDIVRTDGKYIYILSEEKFDVRIVKADNDKLTQIGEIEYKEYMGFEETNYRVCSNAQMYVNNNKIIIIDNVYKYQDYISTDTNDGTNSTASYEDCVYGDNKEYTIVLEYDISDINNPVFENKVMIDGLPISSRMSGDNIYLVAEKSVNTCIYSKEDVDEQLEKIITDCMPHINDEEISADDIYGIGDTSNYHSYEIIVALDISDKIRVTDKCAIMGSTSNMYVSKNYIYTFSTYYDENDMENNTKVNSSRTQIIKTAYGDGEVEPYATGMVNGSILNQFSADEYDGYLRVVSTFEEYNYQTVVYNGMETNDIAMLNDNSTTNAVYVLDDKLNTCGSIEGLAEDERIYSARFMGDKGYFVTFRQTDPLFVVDFSKPETPVILDELKVTGFSSYLHPWSNSMLVGIGEEANDQGRTTGTKISMFNISDLTDIYEQSKIVEENSYSYNYDYKNILIDSDKNLIGFGLQKWHNDYSDCDNVFELYRYENSEFNKVLEYNYYLEEVSYMYCTYRGLYIGDYLYIVTIDKGIQAINLNDLSYGDKLVF